MLHKRDLLIEIGTEELPPKSLSKLSEAFLDGICTGLEKQQINYLAATPYCTPRRLAVKIKGVDEVQADSLIEKRGPALKAAYTADGQATKAALGFATSCGVAVEDLTVLETKEGAWLVHQRQQQGRPSVEFIPNIINQALANLPIAKRMRWADLEAEFVRPVHWALILFGEQAIEAEILGLNSGNLTYGHRFHHPQPIKLANPDEYASSLENIGKVLVVFSQRKEQIRNMVQAAAEQVEGVAIIAEDLLDEVCSLVEYPVPILGSFDVKFLEVPFEALISTMQGHQKYFPITDKQGQLLNYFITISNIDSPQPELIRQGNERVIRPRFADASFFWQQDKANSLESYLERLKTVTFQHKLGSLYAKSKRVAALAEVIAQQLGVSELQAIRAAQLAKCDLMTNMVNEFPELQGIMGEYYARHDGETEAVAIALREQYLPRFAGDVLPTTELGRILGIAERLDTLVGVFGIGQKPTGDKDPFSLRRAALSVLRVCIETELKLNIDKLLQLALSNYETGQCAPDTAVQVWQFILDRLRGYSFEHGYGHDVIEAVLSTKPCMPYDASLRMQAVAEFCQLDAAGNLIGANKRIQNLLKKTTQALPQHADYTYFQQAEERLLLDELQAMQSKVAPLLAQQNYKAALLAMSELGIAIDKFFAQVMVMVEDDNIRSNRLALLKQVGDLFMQIADISKLEWNKS
jgi:glycyl-tRNA synthetase beta chain